MKGILLNGISKEEVSFDVINIYRFQKRFNQAIELSKYGTGLETLFFCPMVLPSRNVHEEVFRYSRKKRELTIKFYLDYETVMDGTKEEYKKAVASRFLAAIGNFHRHQVKDFNVSAFKRDVESFFESEGLLPVQSI